MDVWEDTKSLAHRLKIERTLNFTTMSHEEDEYSSYSQKKIARDPMSHRIIEKRRRDRMNNCLADLSRLIPATYLKKGRGRIEKTEIIEMATKHLRHLQAHACKDPATCEVSLQQQQRDEASTRRLDDIRRQEEVALQRQREQHRLGFQECSSETVRFLVEAEGFYPGQGVCLRLLHHLQQHYDKLVQGMCYMAGDHHGSEHREQSQMTNGHGHQDDTNMLQLDCNSNQSLCESYTKQTTNLNSQMNIGGHSRSLKRSSSQMSDCPSNSVEVLRLNNPATDRLGSVSVRTDEEMDDDHSIHVFGNPAAIERPVSVTSPRLLPLPVAGHSRSHLRDILNQDSCPASYEAKRIRSNSIDSARSCKTTTGVVSVHGYPSSDIYSNRTPEEVYKFKNNIKERFRADILHHNFDSTTPSSHECMVAPAGSSSSHDNYAKLTTSESFGISRMFPSMSGGVSNVPIERSFATLNGFGSFGVNGDLAVKIPSEIRTNRKDATRTETGSTVANGEHRSSRSSSCGSNPSPNSMSSNCFANQAGTSNSTNTSGPDGGKCSVGHSSTSGYSTSGEGSSTVSTCNKTTRNSSLSSGSPVPSRNTTGENSPNCGLLKMEEQSPNSSSESPRPEVPVSLVPIFALHPKGTFYIPLHLESTALTPLLRDRPYLLEHEDSLPLHPVNISVCFFTGRSSACKDRNENVVLSNWKTKNERESTYESYRERMY